MKRKRTEPNLPAWFAEKQDFLAGRKAVISGGTTGIGRATAVQLARWGADVLIFGRHRKELAEAMADIEVYGTRVFGLTADQALIQDVEEVFSLVTREFRSFDILINNAAVDVESLKKASPSEADYAVRANLTGYVTCSMHAIKRMRAGGHIVNVGSMSAEQRGAEGEIYTATKAGVRGFSESLRKTLIGKGIRVTLIEPGWTGSDLISASVAEQKKAQKKLEILTADDIAASIAFSLIQPARCNISLMQVQPLRSE